MQDFDDRYDIFLVLSGATHKKHQREGIHWMLNNELVRKRFVAGNMRFKLPRGGLLADEMGLGKTIQLIGLMELRPVKTLLVLPFSLLQQWREQLIRFTGHEPVIYHGANKSKVSLEFLKNEARLVVCTYNEISGKNTGDLVQFMSLLHLVKWDRVIFDEAHHLRNSMSMLSVGAKVLSSKSKWMSTGTPIHNKIEDFKNLFDIIGYNEVVASNIEFLKSHAYLRRTKESIRLQLPNLTQEMVYVDWTNDEERKIAEDIHGSFNFCKLKFDGEVMDEVLSIFEKGIFAKLARARQTCVMPEMLNGCTGLKLQISSKLDAVAKHIVERRNTGLKLVFCHYRGEIDELERRLILENMKVSKMDGRTSHKERQDILNFPVDVLILQLKTGCEGLNLQKYSEVYFTSPHWNPAIENQAMARCHRIGQEKPTKVFRFAMKGFDESEESLSLDQYCNKIQELKRGLYRAI